MLDTEPTHGDSMRATEGATAAPEEKVGETNFLETRSPLDLFDQAVVAGSTYINSAVTTRDDRYRFLWLTLLAYREGQQDPQEFDNRLTARLNRKPSKREKEHPFFRVLHGLLNKELVAPLQYRPAYTRMTVTLERLDEEFKDVSTVTLDDVIAFIKDRGGVEGIYRDSLKPRSPESETDDAPQPTAPVEKAPKARARREGGRRPKATQSQAAEGTDQALDQEAPQGQGRQDAPITIEIANLGALVTKDGEDATLKIPAFAPGEHSVLIRVGQDGVVEEIIAQSYREAA